MKQIKYDISAIAEMLLSNQKAIKLFINEHYENTYFNVQSINLEQGLYFLTIEIEPTENTLFVHYAEKNNNWMMLSCLENKINQKPYQGIYIGFSDTSSAIFAKANETIRIYVILLHHHFIKTYNYCHLFDSIRQRNKSSYYQKIQYQSLDSIKFYSKYNGLIKIKKNIFKILEILQNEEFKIGTYIKENIEVFCQIAVKRKLNLGIFIANEVGLEQEAMKDLFYDIFKISIQKYYNNFKLEFAKKYLKNEKVEIDTVIVQNIKYHPPITIQLASKFDLPSKTFKRLFFEEFGRSFEDYHRNLRFSFAKTLLSTGEMKVYQISKILGYAQPISFINSFRKIEGTTPKNIQKTSL